MFFIFFSKLVIFWNGGINEKNFSHVLKKVGTPCEAHRPWSSLVLGSRRLQGREIVPEGI